MAEPLPVDSAAGNDLFLVVNRGWFRTFTTVDSSRASTASRRSYNTRSDSDDGIPDWVRRVGAVDRYAVRGTRRPHPSGKREPCRLPAPRPRTSVPRRARDATRRSTTAGSRRAWRTSSGIPEHPDAIIPDFRQAESARHVHEGQIAFVYGSKWKQRYFTKVGDDYFPLPAQWDVTHGLAAVPRREGNRLVDGVLPPENSRRPTGPLCDGCHSVNYNIQTRPSPNGTSAARNATARQRARRRPVARHIVNPARLDRSAPSTCASSAIHKGSRSSTRSRASTTTGRSAFASA